MPVVTLTTDFGTGSSYVAQMKGVLLSLCRETPTIVDLSHEIPPQDVFAGAMFLGDACPRFPPKTLHIAVIDPGVGTSRRIVYAELGEQKFIGPDNGLFSLVAKSLVPKLIVSIENEKFWLPERSQTFHGRDIMAPVAAAVMNKVDPREFGPRVERLELNRSWPECETKGCYQVSGEVVHVDSFGNLITNIPVGALLDEFDQPSVADVQIRSEIIRGLSKTYGDAPSGSLIALIDSGGRLEIAVVNESAAELLQAGRGEKVVVRTE
jgi:S-adenosyl-L-methionine hydrolase (adenosine-forming)